MNPFTVYKLNHLGEITLSYEGNVVANDETSVCIRALFGFATRDLGYVVLKTGDIFTEWFYTDKWYNVFRVQDVDSGEIKGYYCNLTRPASISENSVKADDLALDIFVKPDGSTLTLDEAEYNALPLTDAERAHVQAAVAEIHNLVQLRIEPFADLASGSA
jgi:protein associated with RNAse G/E